MALALVSSCGSLRVTAFLAQSYCLLGVKGRRQILGAVHTAGRCTHTPSPPTPRNLVSSLLSAFRQGREKGDQPAAVCSRV